MTDMKQNSDISQHLCLVLAPRKVPVRFSQKFPEEMDLQGCEKEFFFVPVLRIFWYRSYNFFHPTISLRFYRGVFSYSSLHLHHKYPVCVSLCIHSDVLKMETKWGSAQEHVTECFCLSWSCCGTKRGQHGCTTACYMPWESTLSE